MVDRVRLSLTSQSQFVGLRIIHPQGGDIGDSSFSSQPLQALQAQVL